MASSVGDVTFGSTPNNVKRTVCLLDANSSATSAPSLSTDGVPAYEDTTELYASTPAGAFFLGEAPDTGRCTAHVVSTAGGGTMTAAVAIWGYLGGTGLGKWVLAKSLNGGSNITEASSDRIGYNEVVDGLGQYDRLAAQLTAVSNTAVKASLDLSTKTTQCDTVIEAQTAGADGNSITIAFQAGSSDDAGSLDESAHPALVFSYKTGVTTVTNFESAVAASTYLHVKTGGTGANVLASPGDTFSAAALAGGVDATSIEVYLTTTRS